MSVGELIFGLALMGVAVGGFLARNAYVPWAWRHHLLWRRSEDQVPARVWFSYYASLGLLLLIGVLSVTQSFSQR